MRHKNSGEKKSFFGREVITIKKETKQSIQYLMIIICILASIFFGAYKFSLYADYTEDRMS